MALQCDHCNKPVMYDTLKCSQCYQFPIAAKYTTEEQKMVLRKYGITDEKLLNNLFALV